MVGWPAMVARGFEAASFNKFFKKYYTVILLKKFYSYMKNNDKYNARSKTKNKQKK